MWILGLKGLKRNPKSTCINPLSPLGTQKKDLVSALQMCLVTSLLSWILPQEEDLLPLDNYWDFFLFKLCSCHQYLCE